MASKLSTVKIGNKYNEWTVIDKGSKPKYFKCRCSCGVEREVYYANLTSGKSKSCGHIRKPKRNDEKYIGNKFGRLTVIKRVNDVGRSKYLCKCDCGNEVVVSVKSLGSRRFSCGCLQDETSRKKLEKIPKEAFEKYSENFVEGTNLTNLTQKLSKNNKTGVKGVFKGKNGRYYASIMIARKRIHLGVYDTLGEAEDARKEGEEKYFKPIIDKYKDRLE